MDSQIKVYRDTFKQDISCWVYIKIRYENCHRSVIIDNMKQDCVLLEKKKKKKKTTEASKGRLRAVCAMCSYLKRTEKYGSLNDT